MSQRPPNDPTPIDYSKPFPSENVMAEGKAAAQKQHAEADANAIAKMIKGAKAPGVLPDQPTDLPVVDSKPFKNLRSS